MLMEDNSLVQKINDNTIRSVVEAGHFFWSNYPRWTNNKAQVENKHKYKNL